MIWRCWGTSVTPRGRLAPRGSSARSPPGTRGVLARRNPSSGASSPSPPAPILRRPWPNTWRGARNSATTAANCCRSMRRRRWWRRSWRARMAPNAAPSPCRKVRSRCGRAGRAQPGYCHSERSEESIWTSAAHSRGESRTGFFAALRMTRVTPMVEVRGVKPDISWSRGALAALARLWRVSPAHRGPFDGLRAPSLPRSGGAAAPAFRVRERFIVPMLISIRIFHVCADFQTSEIFDRGLR